MANVDPATCGCLKCQDDRRAYHIALNNPSLNDLLIGMFGFDPYFRYACEICGFKRCPHHTNHALACTTSNETGQPGSVYQ